MMSIFMTSIVGWVLFTTILTFQSTMLTSLVHEKNPNQEVVIIDNLKKLLQRGMEQLKP